MDKPKVLMIDDDPVFVEGYITLLGGGYKVYSANEFAQGIRIIEELRPDILLLDITMKTEKEGLDGIPYLKRRFPWLKIIIVTNWDSHLISREALNMGADDFFVKSDRISNLKNIIHHLLASREIEDRPNSAYPIAFSPAFENVLMEARKVARTSCVVLITGETGVGKEVVARYIHEHSPRKNKEFVAVNCGGIPKTLVESEFFGFEKGAFTGALQRKPGKFELADRGTLLLDEIEELDLHAQAALLRAIQTMEIEHIGGNKKIDVDVRLIVATQHDLRLLVKNGKFREDLYYRLAVYPIHVPPLRERIEDILPLAQYFLNQIVKQEKLRKKRFTQAALLMLKSYHWPGNVRELKNVVEHAGIHSMGNEIRPGDLFLAFAERREPRIPYDLAKEEAVKNFQRKYIREALLRNGGNISRTAEEIGLSRQALQNLIKTLNLDAGKRK